jgi:hypothetical protein
MGKVKVCLFCTVFSLFFLTPAFSETIFLKSGQKVEGKIIEKNDDYVKLDFFGVQLTYYKDEIASILDNEAAAAKNANLQMESLYKAYISSRNLPEKPKEEGDVKFPLPSAQQDPGASVTSDPVSLQAASLDQLPPEYQKMIQSLMQGVQAKSGDPTGMPSGMDVSQLPPEYQKIIKSALSGLQMPKTGTSEAKK